MRPARFRNRREAGAALAGRLRDLGSLDPVVVGLPRGGVPVAFEVARALGAPLDIALVRKLGAPMHPELGVGALAEDGVAVIDPLSVERLGIAPEELRAVADRERAELDRRRSAYRTDHPEVDVEGRTVILVDDGIATGLTAIAVARAMRARGAARVILAVPVCPPGVTAELDPEFDGVVCLLSPQPFLGVGAGYADFEPTSDEEVVDLLRRSRTLDAGGPGAGEPSAQAERDVRIPASDGAVLGGTVTVPDGPAGLIVFAHGSGSSRRSPRNLSVAARLGRRGFATLLFDLLTDEESADRRNVFDIELLAHRLHDATEWAREDDELAGLPVGYFGASTGAAAALVAAARPDAGIDAVVSRGGRPDLAGPALADVSAPTLLIVGGADPEVLELNRGAAERLPRARVAVVPGAGHLFEEPGALARVAQLAEEWFQRFLGEARAPATAATGGGGR